VTTTTPSVSVIITTFNYGDFIVEAIESVLGQTRPADEVFVVDDGSTDQTRALVAPYVERGQVNYIWQENSGPSEARNRGFERSSGDMIAFLDADDTWLPDKLERQLEWLAAHPRASMVSGPMIWWHVPRDERWVVPYKTMPAERFQREVTIRNLVGNPSMALIRRTALDQAGLFDTTLRWGQDWEIFVRLARVGEVGFVDEPVIVYRWHRGNLSHERRLEQLSMNQSISRRAISTHEPRWQRPILRTRSWSVFEFDRARIIHIQGGRRIKVLRHATLALVSWPLEDTQEKAKLLGRSLVGEATYRRATNGVREKLRRARPAG
jgi:glycosyltransferase involved in cell wall biosynthesis